VSRSTREYAQGESGTGALPSTRVVAGGQHFGIDPRLPGSFQRTGASLAQSLGIVWSQHRLQLGIDAEAGSHDDTYAYARQGEFVFGGADEFARGEGSFVRSAASLRPAAFTVLRFGAHAQDTWNASPDLQVVAGVRYDLETLPGDEVRSNEAWLAYTGLSNADVAGEVRTVSPRFGLTWDVGGRGSWIVRATAGIYASSIPPHVLTELLTLDGSATTHRGMGQLGWPSAPGSQAAPDVGPRLTLLGPDFRGPLTRRASFGLTRQLGAAATLQLSGTYRETDFLPRRSDVNLQTEPVAFDQHGRPVYGSLVQSGQLVAAPGPNRRFADFDLVSALNADGWSRRWGVTAAVESDEEGPFGLFARYTYSRTTDNWLSGQGGGPEAQLTPFRGSGGDDWTEGVSDFDLPHQMAAGFELRPSGSLQPRLTGIYRYRSGYPFTPGFRDGVDVNADGSGRNDPAFVDPAIPGTPELVSRWSCLRGQVGGFAERNACRLPGVHSLDLRLGLTLVQSSGVAASLFVDGVNLIESALAVPDRAVYLVDAGGTLTRDSALGTVSLPLVANPNFGRPLGRFSAGRLLRVGLQVTF
jgi:hypothetical protein